MTEFDPRRESASLHGLESSGTTLRGAGPSSRRGSGRTPGGVSSGQVRELLFHPRFSPENDSSRSCRCTRRPSIGHACRFLGHGGRRARPRLSGGRVAARRRLPERALEGLAWDVFAGEQLPGRRPGPHAPRRVVATRGDPPRRGPGWEAYLAGRSANLRQQLRRRLRAASEAGARASVSRTSTRSSAIWRRSLRSTPRWGEATGFGDTPFHRELAHAALARDWLRLWLLEVDGPRRRLARLSGGPGRELLPGGSRPGVRPSLGRLRPRGTPSGRRCGRSAGVPLRSGRRGVQVPVQPTTPGSKRSRSREVSSGRRPTRPHAPRVQRETPSRDAHYGSNRVLAIESGEAAAMTGARTTASSW